MCELLQMLPAQLLMALQTATASETFYGQVESHESVPLCSCRFLSYTPTDGKDTHEFPPPPNGHPPPAPLYNGLLWAWTRPLSLSGHPQ